MRGTRTPISPRVQELQKKNKKVRKKRALVRIILVILLLGSLTILLNAKALEIGAVFVDQNLKDKDKIASYLETKLSEHSLLVIPKNSIFLLQQKKISKDLIANFPILKSASVVRTGRKLEISGAERVPAYLYCGTAPKEEFGKTPCELVDENGFDFRTAPVFSGPVYFTFYLENGAESMLGKNILPPDVFKNLISFKDGLKDLAIHPTGIIVGGDSTRTLLLAESGKATYGKIIFSDAQNAGALLSDLKLVIQDEPLKSHILNPESISYIDVRYKDKVYYKLQ
jgi:hypothetical protein